MPQFDVDGARLAYDDEGPRDAGGGVPWLFVHGWTANRHRWDHQTAHFSARRRVIRLDLRGHGRAPGPGCPASPTWRGTSSRSSTTWRWSGARWSVTRWAG